MNVPASVLFLALALPLAVAGCDPYERRQGEYYAGSVDPARFPKEYLGAGATATRPGGGRFSPAAAKVAGRDVFYYSFPAPRNATGDLAALRTPLAYVFDPEPPSPFPAQPRCAVPPGYQWDQRLEAFRLDEQGSIFTSLPGDAGYIPVVAQVPVTSMGQPCQDIKSEATVLSHPGVSVPRRPPAPDMPNAQPTGIPDGSLLAWAIINPAAQVNPVDPKTQLGPQRWGWFNHYLLAYLDGGYLPTRQVMDMDRSYRALVAQRLYYPRQVGTRDAMGMLQLRPGALGQGHDVLQAARGEPGYSALCQVFTYTAADPENPATDAAQIEMDVMAMPMPDPMTPFIFCLQVR